jgi:hypothetical protein
MTPETTFLASDSEEGLTIGSAGVGLTSPSPWSEEGIGSVVGSAPALTVSVGKAWLAVGEPGMMLGLAPISESCAAGLQATRIRLPRAATVANNSRSVMLQGLDIAFPFLIDTVYRPYHLNNPGETPRKT